HGGLRDRRSRRHGRGGHPTDDDVGHRALIPPARFPSFVKSGDPLDSVGLGSGFNLRSGPLAQLAERRADNAEVGGSSPPRPTNRSQIRTVINLRVETTAAEP